MVSGHASFQANVRSVRALNRLPGAKPHVLSLTPQSILCFYPRQHLGVLLPRGWENVGGQFTCNLSPCVSLRSGV